MGRIAEVIAALLSASAGIYLLSKNSVPVDIGGQDGQSWLEVLAHGIGVYFIARGLWMLGHVGQQHEAARSLERLVEIAEREGPRQE